MRKSRALAVTALFVVGPAIATAAIPTATEWRGPGWYLWVSGIETGQRFNIPIQGPYPTRMICEAIRDRRYDRQFGSYTYDCSRHAQTWGARSGSRD